MPGSVIALLPLLSAAAAWHCQRCASGCSYLWIRMRAALNMATTRYLPRHPCGLSKREYTSMNQLQTTNECLSQETPMQEFPNCSMKEHRRHHCALAADESKKSSPQRATKYICCCRMNCNKKGVSKMLKFEIAMQHAESYPEARKSQ
jgi:hypothetical protein